MSVETTKVETTKDGVHAVPAAPSPSDAQPVVPRPRKPEQPLVVVDAVGDSAIRHSCGAMVTQLFSVGGPSTCPLCHETV